MEMGISPLTIRTSLFGKSLRETRDERLLFAPVPYSSSSKLKSQQKGGIDDGLDTDHNTSYTQDTSSDRYKHNLVNPRQRKKLSTSFPETELQHQLQTSFF